MLSSEKLWQSPTVPLQQFFHKSTSSSEAWFLVATKLSHIYIYIFQNSHLANRRRIHQSQRLGNNERKTPVSTNESETRLFPSVSVVHSQSWVMLLLSTLTHGPMVWFFYPPKLGGSGKPLKSFGWWLWWIIFSEYLEKLNVEPYPGILCYTGSMERTLPLWLVKTCQVTQ